MVEHGAEDAEVDWRRMAADMGVEVTDEFSTMLRVYQELMKDPVTAAELQERLAALDPGWEATGPSDPPLDDEGGDEVGLAGRELESYLQEALAALARAGTTITDPLSAVEVGDVEAAVGAPLPPELRSFLSIGLPVGDAWPRWREPTRVVEEWQSLLLEMFDFDIDENDYWFPGWGPRPSDLADAKAIARAEVTEWPPLVPVHAHRVIATDPSSVGNPVWSFSQPVDTVYLGVDFGDYLSREFRLPPPPRRRQRPRYIEYWTDAFDLDRLWMS